MTLTKRKAPDGNMNRREFIKTVCNIIGDVHGAK